MDLNTFSYCTFLTLYQQQSLIYFIAIVQNDQQLSHKIENNITWINIRIMAVDASTRQLDI